MSEKPLEIDSEHFKTAVDAVATKLMSDALKESGESMLAVTALVLAAARATAMTKISFPTTLSLFAAQHQAMLEWLEKKQSTEAPVTPAEVVLFATKERLRN